MPNRDITAPRELKSGNRFRRQLLPALLLSLSLASPVSASTPLAEKYPPARLAQLLLDREAWHPFPRLEERTGWTVLSPELSGALREAGETALETPLPSLPASLYLEYARTGNRSHYETAQRTRRTLLQSLVLAECVEHEGRCLDAIADVVWAICEESSWCYPAHVGAQKAGPGLPDVDEPIVALFSAETAVSLAWTDYLLGAALDRVSPRIRERLHREIDQRILTPFLERDDFWWMGFGNRGRPNNWNPWINASVLTTALLTEDSAERRTALVHKALRCLDRFLQPYPEDGSCDEGPGYWGHAGASLFDALELLYSATDGRLNEFGDPRIQEIGRFIYRAHVAGDWFVPLGDCSARFTTQHDVAWRYGRAIRDDRLTAFAAHGATLESILEGAGNRYFGRLLPAVFDAADILAQRDVPAPLVRDVWLGSEDMQLLTARSRAGTPRGLFLAAWGAHNAQSHNHNDVGNFIVFADGQPVLVDVGVTTYTAKTFSRRRYEIWAMQSAFHNLPTINGQMQHPGRDAAARRVRHGADDATAWLELDLAAAYPPEARVRSWFRRVTLQRKGAVALQDRWDLTAIEGPLILNLMTPCEAAIESDGTLRLQPTGATGEAAARPVHITLAGAKLHAKVEPRPLQDARLRKVWGDQLNRIVLTAVDPPLRGHWQLTLEQLP